MTTWLAVWTRAVIEPAWRRAGAVWAGCAIVAGVIFGGTGMLPHDLTRLALGDPGVGLVLAGIWLFMFAPAARLILRPERAGYLASLPHAATGPFVVGAVALVGLQLPWLVLWLLGEGVRGLAVVATTTAIVVGLAAIRAPGTRVAWPGWRTGGQALARIHLRALYRRAADTLIRGVGLAALAGATGGLFVRNNQLTGESAALLGTGVMAIVLVPARIGTLGVLLDTHRRSTWLADSLGIAPLARTVALARAIIVVHAVATAVALAAAALIARPDPGTLGVWIVVALGIAVSSALCETRVVLRAQDSPAAAARLVVGALAVAALAILCLGLLGASGVIGFAAAGLLAIATAP